MSEKKPSPIIVTITRGALNNLKGCVSEPDYIKEFGKEMLTACTLAENLHVITTTIDRERKKLQASLTMKVESIEDKVKQAKADADAIYELEAFELEKVDIELTAAELDVSRKALKNKEEHFRPDPHTRSLIIAFDLTK